MNKNSVIDWSLIIAIGIAWGSSFLFIKVSAPEVGPITLVFSRLLIASMLLTPFKMLSKIFYVNYYKKYLRDSKILWSKKLFISIFKNSLFFIPLDQNIRVWF